LTLVVFFFKIGIMLNQEELERYKRQIAIPGLGETGQVKLKNARILIIGAGGLGSPAALYLAAAGMGCLRIVDSDKVELSNLNRQLLHGTPDIGREKTVSASQKLRALNPAVKIETVQDRTKTDNIDSLLNGCDGILDATDNLETRYILNKAAVKAGLPLFHGAVSGFEGRALTVLPLKSACLMCLYHGVALNQKPPVIGATPGVIGCIQATEAIKYITGLGKLLAGRLLIYDGLSMSFREIQVSRDPECPHCGPALHI
jgi:molybdopterin/thiamine biosynthesis adenylyltransferase